MVFHACVVSPHFLSCSEGSQVDMYFFFCFVLYFVFFLFVLFVTLTNSTRFGFRKHLSSAFRTILAFYPCGFFVSLSFLSFFFSPFAHYLSAWQEPTIAANCDPQCFPRLHP